MNSLEALERLFGSYVSSNCYGINYKQDDEDYNIIKQDLNRIEKLEEEYKEYQKYFDREQKMNFDLIIRLTKENEKLKQALDKACEKLDYTCLPVEEELIEDLDCDNNCKECWKKHFLKEVLLNE